MRTNEQHAGAGLTAAARFGLWLFFVYLALYAGFMALTVIDARAMGRSAGPANLAILYGFFLIAAALILAFVYMRLCWRAERGEGTRR